MKRLFLLLLLVLLPLPLGGCSGGQEIEDCLFVLSMAIDPAPEGNLRVTIKALSGTQEAIGGGKSAQPQEDSTLETPEPGYIVLSATAPSCLRALSLLSATTPRTVNLSQLREVVLSRALAQTDAALTILKEIHGMYRANGEAIVVVTPDDAGDFIRRQRAILGVRLSQYLDVLFDHFSQSDMIPPDAQLARVIAAMQSDTMDAMAVYAAGNAMDSPLTLGENPLDALPGHLPRTSPAENEYLGAAVFCGQKMAGTLTGEEIGLLSLMLGKAQRRSTFIGNAHYTISLPTRVRRTIDEDGALRVRIAMRLTLAAGEAQMSAQEIAAQIERECVGVLLKLRAMGSDAAGFGRIAVRRHLTQSSWTDMDWPLVYMRSPVRVSADVRVL